MAIRDQANRTGRDHAKSKSEINKVILIKETVKENCERACTWRQQRQSGREGTETQGLNTEGNDTQVKPIGAVKVISKEGKPGKHS